MSVEPIKTCHIMKAVTVDIEVEAQFPDWICYSCPDIESKIKALEQEISKFESFLRDHRSQDVVKLFVRRIKKDLCSACKKFFEEASDPDFENGRPYCDNCGAFLEGWTK